MSSIYAFHGVDGKMGTTMITQSIAEFITLNRKDISVMIISMHGRPGTEYVDKVGESIEGIKLHLNNRLLNPQNMIRDCKKTANLYMLGGVESIGQVRSYYPEMAAYLLDSIKDLFDLILVDTGNDIDNGLAVGALEYISNRYCLVTQQESILKRYERIKPIYDKLGIEFSSCIVNKYKDRDPYNLYYVGKRLGIRQDKLMKIKAADYGRQAESDHRTLLFYKNEDYCMDILLLANQLLSEAQIEPIEVERKKKWSLFT